MSDKFTPENLKALAKQVAIESIRLAEGNYFVARVIAKNSQQFINEEEQKYGQPNLGRSFIRPLESNGTQLQNERVGNLGLPRRPESAEQNSSTGSGVLDSGDDKATRRKRGKGDTDTIAKSNNRVGRKKV